MKITNLDDWSPSSGDMFLVKAIHASTRKFRFIISVNAETVIVLCWHMSNFSLHTYGREWFENYRELIVEVYRP